MGWAPRVRSGSLCLFLLVSNGSPLAFAQSDSPSEYQVKAAFLFHFAQYVDWPPEAFQNASAPLTYCTLGEDPFHGALEASLNGKTIGTHPLRIKHLKQNRDANGCQVLFLSAAEEKSVVESLERLRGAPVLTVGDSENFARDGGMIRFCLQDNKVRFEINVSAAEHAGLRISARLLALAKTVFGEPKGT